VVSEDAGREDLRSLHLSNKELERDTNCNTVAKFYWKEKESIGTTKERVVALARWHRSSVLCSKGNL
jgi:hypothetical protein